MCWDPFIHFLSPTRALCHFMNGKLRPREALSCSDPHLGLSPGSLPALPGPRPEGMSGRGTEQERVSRGLWGFLAGICPGACQGIGVPGPVLQKGGRYGCGLGQ